jgi:hypothetical protein
MKFSDGILLGAALVLVLATFPAEARKLNVKKSASFETEPAVPLKHLTYGRLPKAPVPPSGPGKRGSDSPLPHGDLSYGMLPKGPVAPSGSGKKGNDSPLPHGDLSYGMLPKGPVPPSGPNDASSDYPIPPPDRFVPGDVKTLRSDEFPVPAGNNEFYFYSPPPTHPLEYVKETRSSSDYPNPPPDRFVPGDVKTLRNDEFPVPAGNNEFYFYSPPPTHPLGYVKENRLRD